MADNTQTTLEKSLRSFSRKAIGKLSKTERDLLESTSDWIISLERQMKGSKDAGQN